MSALATLTEIARFLGGLVKAGYSPPQILSKNAILMAFLLAHTQKTVGKEIWVIS